MADSKLDKFTLIPLGVVVAVVFSVAGGAVWLNKALVSIDFRLKSIEEKVERDTSAHWSNEDMRRWVEIFSAKNPDIQVPRTGGQ